MSDREIKADGLTVMGVDDTSPYFTIANTESVFTNNLKPNPPRYKMFDVNAGNFLEQPLFFGDCVSTARYDKQSHPIFEKLITKQLSFFWRPEEVDLSAARGEFKDLAPHKRHIFLSNLKYQTLLDSVQGRAPTAAFLSICSLPELETWIETWTFSETIHSRSYTHIIRSVLSDPSAELDTITEIDEIINRAAAVTSEYDNLINMQYVYNVAGGYGVHYVDNVAWDCSEYAMKKQLIRTLFSVLLLEGARFYVSFACSFQFAELGVLEGNAKIVKLIARDENLHKSGVLYILRTLMGSEDPVYKQVFTDLSGWFDETFEETTKQEDEWIDYLFQYGALEGLNSRMLKAYLRYVADKVYFNLFKVHKYPDYLENPIPWIDGWFGSDTIQIAPQETELESYLVGQIDSEIGEGDFSDFV